MIRTQYLFVVQAKTKRKIIIRSSALDGLKSESVDEHRVNATVGSSPSNGNKARSVNSPKAPLFDCIKHIYDILSTFWDSS